MFFEADVVSPARHQAKADLGWLGGHVTRLRAVARGTVGLNQGVEYF